MVNSPLIRPYLLEGVALGGDTLDSHDYMGPMSLHNVGRVVGGRNSPLFGDFHRSKGPHRRPTSLAADVRWSLPDRFWFFTKVPTTNRKRRSFQVTLAKWNNISPETNIFEPKNDGIFQVRNLPNFHGAPIFRGIPVSFGEGKYFTNLYGCFQK